MSLMKDLAERVSIEMGCDGELTPEVLREAQARIDYMETMGAPGRYIWAARPTERHTVLVTFHNDDFFLTDINGTKEEIEAYYVGKWFNVGNGSDGDSMQQVERIAFMD